ncbi:MAG TPA: trypsin-like peptidase domain-containing protein [Chryseosolibacter sp.]
MNSTVKTIVIGFIAGLAGTGAGYQYIIKPNLPKDEVATFDNVKFDSPGMNRASDIPNTTTTSNLTPVDFSAAASKATPSVVFINSISEAGGSTYWDWFFGEGSNRQTQVSSGSGVIFSADGYIVTNNHVVSSAQRIEVNYNKRVYTAELVGTDPSTDLAVIKIEESNLPAITLGSSKNLQVGEWVVAVGNPFTLASTVTAGIVSAKGRRIGILEDKFPIESFIQTDAAINPGNSGGALVNKNGDLVGINTAILSRTGSYTGYAFAVPVDIAKKVFDDLVKYGIVQKAVLGANVSDYDYATAVKYDLDTKVKTYNGVLLERLDKEGPAADAGLKLGDVITKVNGIDINSQSEFEEALSYRYPGDKISITYLRDNRSGTVNVTLVNRKGDTGIIKRKIVSAPALGAQLEATDYGVKVFKIADNSLFKRLGVNENFTIERLNNESVSEPEEVIRFFDEFRGRGYIIGINNARQRVQIPFIKR